jgi:hypothetical protein
MVATTHLYAAMIITHVQLILAILTKVVKTLRSLVTTVMNAPLIDAIVKKVVNISQSMQKKTPIAPDGNQNNVHQMKIAKIVHNVQRIPV